MFSRQIFLRSNLALAILLAPLAISTGLRAVPVPKTQPVVRTVRMVQQSIPMPDGVHHADGAHNGLRFRDRESAEAGGNRERGEDGQG